MKTVIEMARDAGLHLYVNDLTEEPYALVVERFAELVRADERKKRDEAVKLLNTVHMGNESARSQDIIRAAIHVLQRNAPEELAAAIRARSNT